MEMLEKQKNKFVFPSDSTLCETKVQTSEIIYIFLIVT